MSKSATANFLWAARRLAPLGAMFLVAACMHSPEAGRVADAPVLENVVPPAAAAVLVRGWISQTSLELEPVLVTTAALSAATDVTGPYRLRGFDDAGALRFELAFDQSATASVAGRAGHHFMFVVPVAGDALELARVELDAGDGRELVRSARLPPAALVAALSGDESLSVDMVDGRVTLRWDAARFPLLQMRDPAEGVVLALVRDGELALETEAEALELAISEGVRSAAAIIRLR